MRPYYELRLCHADILYSCTCDSNSFSPCWTIPSASRYIIYTRFSNWRHLQTLVVSSIARSNLAIDHSQCSPIVASLDANLPLDSYCWLYYYYCYHRWPLCSWQWQKQHSSQRNQHHHCYYWRDLYSWHPSMMIMMHRH